MKMLNGHNVNRYKHTRGLVAVKLLVAITIIGILIKCPECAAVQATLHVSPHGSDESAGTAEKPFQTIDRARQAIRKINTHMTGDVVVMLHGGVYPLQQTATFETEDSGTNGHDVVYRAVTGEQPILSGGRRITNWQPDVGGRWKAKTDLDDFRQLYVGGVRAIRARSRKLGGDTNAGRWEFLHDPSRGGGLKGAELIGNQAYRIPAVEMAGWDNPGDIEFCYVVVWSHVRCKVQSIVRVEDRAVVVMLQPYFTYARIKPGVQPDLPAYIENAFELLDEPGEWYFDRPAKTVYYIPRAGEDMNAVEVIAPAVEKLVELRGTLDKPVEHLRFEGITFQHGSWLRPSRIGHADVQANFTIDPDRKDSYVRADGGFVNPDNEYRKSPANVVCHAAKSICFERCTFAQLGGAGLDIEVGSQDNVVSGCRFYDISGSAVQVGDVQRDDHHPDDLRKIVKNNSVVNCSIHDCGVEYLGGVGVWVGYTERTRIAHNEICRLPYSAVSVGWGWGQQDAGGGAYPQPFRHKTPTPARDNCIELNHIHDVMRPMLDGGAIYTLGNQPGTIVRANHIHDNVGSAGGLYLDEGSGFIEVTGNLVYGVEKAMQSNNAGQNRKATCNVHDNFLGSSKPNELDTFSGGTPAAARPIVEHAGLEPAYRDLLRQKP